MLENDMRIGKVRELHRYPVKSMRGELLETIELDQRGVSFDRFWATYGDRGKLGSGKNSRRFQRIGQLASMRARCEMDVPIITLPDGTEYRGDDPRIDDFLSAACGQQVALRAESGEAHFDTGSVHVVTTGSIARVEGESGISLDARRLRPNIVIETDRRITEKGAENIWPGLFLAFSGGTVLKVDGRMDRCMMVNQAIEELPQDNRILKAINTVNQMMLGVFAQVVNTGKISVGDDVRLVDNGGAYGGTGSR
jgi:uncharacterized protein YcbX